MAKRLHKTTGDYLAIGIGPALIMVLVWSLIAFLLEVFYQGQYSDRLKLIMALFVFGAVLIGRISIEEGRQRAGLFAIALGAVTALAIWRFSEPHGGALSTVALPIDFALLGLIWWCAHKLVWDCTLIDEEQDASGEGLLATMGWEESSKAGQVRKSSPAPSSDNVDFDRKTKPHAPGKWVIYFSLAALPVFGIGQLFIPQSDLERRQYALRLMVQYVAAGMGLLLATSFLGLRRYLRQRHVQMPTRMAGGWVGAGAALIVAVLLFCLLIPRPDAELAISSLTGEVESDFQTSNYAVGSDGPLQKQGDRSRASDDPDAKGQGGNQQGSKAGGQGDKNGQGKSGNGEKGPSQDGGSAKGNQSDEKASGDNGENKNQGGQANQNESRNKDGSKGEDDKNGQEEDSSDDSNSNRNSQEKKDESTSGDEQQSGGGNTSRQNEDQGGSRRGEKRERRSSSSSESTQKASSWSPARWFGNTLKWIFYAVLLALGVFLAWRYRREIAQAWRQMIEDLKHFWAGLFGGKRKPQGREQLAPASQEAVELHRSFAEYHNPFLTGAAAERPPEEVVTYSFRALEAWGREHGAPRQPEETPREFAAHIAVAADHLAGDAQCLAGLYSQVAYAPGTIDAHQIETLRPLWGKMEQSSPHAPREVRTSRGA